MRISPDQVRNYSTQDRAARFGLFQFFAKLRTLAYQRGFPPQSTRKLRFFVV
jgi:hypothetical protein